jgi:hypothetical protein
MCGFFTTDELDDLLFEASEVARFLLEVEGTTLDIDEEIDIEDRITKVMRSVGEAAKTILRSRADEEEAPGNPALKKHVGSPSSPDNDVSHAGERKGGTKIKDRTPESVSDTPVEIIPEEILPGVDKKIALERTLSRQ